MVVIYVCFVLFISEVIGIGVSVRGKVIRVCSIVLIRIWVWIVVNINFIVRFSEGKFIFVIVII